MENLEQIICRERVADNSVYLYKVDDYWIAYEHSAFYLHSICSTDYIFQYKTGDDALLVAVLKDCYKISNPLLELRERSREQLVFHSSITCKGFEYWKRGMLSLLPTELRTNNIPRLLQITS